LRGLIDSAASQEHQIALLWKALEAVSAGRPVADCVPQDAARDENFEAAKLNQLVGK
jgi:serine O-acetyltransferase